MLCLLVTVNVSVGNYSSWKEAVRPGWMAVKHFGDVGHGAILLFLWLVGASDSPRCCAAGALPEGSLATSHPCDPHSVLINCSTETWLPSV